MKDYLVASGAVGQLQRLRELTQEFYKDMERDEKMLAYVVSTPECEKPFEVLAFDAGLARFFKDTPFETVVLKIAGGGSESVQASYEHLMAPAFLHIFSGMIKNPRVFSSITDENDEKGASALAALELMRLFDAGCLYELDLLFSEFGLNEFRSEVRSWLSKSKKLPEIDNVAREFAEWFYALRALKVNSSDLLIVKDGSLMTNQFGSGHALAARLAKIFTGSIQNLSPLIVGVVKESRFIKDEGHVVSSTVRAFAKRASGNWFFKIHNGLESILDPTPLDEKTIERLFLSVSGGRTVFEVQFPKMLTNNADQFAKARATILSQITSLYGGSVAANSVAHKAASLSEAESRTLERELEKLTENSDQESGNV